MDKTTILETYDLEKAFDITGGLFKRTIGYVNALNGVDISLNRGKILSLVGESGCGKTTLGRVITRLYPATNGAMIFDAPEHIMTEFRDLYQKHRDAQIAHNTTDEQTKQRIDVLRNEFDLHTFSNKRLNQIRSKIQMVFQDPYGSLNPRFTVKDIVGEGLTIHNVYNDKQEQMDYIQDLLQKTGIDPSYIMRYAHEFSGGQRQRLGIARALALKPKLIILDEPVSALDVSVQVQIIDLLNKLKDDFNLTYIFIAHDLSVVDYFTDDIAVMYLGSVVEQGHKSQINKTPLHPYTQALVSAIPTPVPGKKKDRIQLKGEVPSPSHMPSGCPFHTRCPYVKDICKVKKPMLKPIEKQSTHLVSCWLHHDEA